MDMIRLAYVVCRIIFMLGVVSVVIPVWATSKQPLTQVQIVQQNIAKQQRILLQLVKSRSYTDARSVSSYPKLAEHVIKTEVNTLVDTLLHHKDYDLKTRLFFLSRVMMMMEEYKKLYYINMANVMILSRVCHAFMTIATHLEIDVDWQTMMEQNDIETKKILLDLFFYKPSLNLYRNHIILHYVQKYPEQGLQLMRKFGADNFDTLFTYVLRKAPEIIFKDLGAANSLLKKWYSSNNNPDLKMLLTLKHQHKAERYFPFYEDLKKKHLTIKDIQSTVNYPPLYFRLLVKIHLKHLQIIKETRDTPVNFQVLWDYMYRTADEYIITPINDLHNAPNSVRFRRLQGFVVSDLYYLIIAGNDNLYTSSFLYIYTLFLKNLGTKNGYNFLKAMQFDRYRRFLKILAVYSHLYGKHKNDFLLTMSEQERFTLMRIFVNAIPIEATFFLEDAIDVATAFTGIENKTLLGVLFASIENTYQRYQQEKNKKGSLVYFILKKLIHISYTPKDSNLYDVKWGAINEFNALPYSVGKMGLVEQVFFYGDEDSYNSFMHLIYTFSNKKKWQIIYTEDWIHIRSKEGIIPIHIYANKPCKGVNQGYLAAQTRLKNYFLKRNIIPSIVMHRGHSYFVTNTINQLSPHVKLVVLGSCGSYSLVSRILRLSPEAHLISTRQIGKTSINSRIFYYLNEELRSQGQIEWDRFWEKMGTYFHKGKGNNAQNYFDDYIPPNKNLGAIFIKYYYSLMSKLY